MKDVSYDVRISYPKNGYGTPFLRKTTISGKTEEPAALQIPSGKILRIPGSANASIEYDALNEKTSVFVNKKLLIRKTKTSVKIYTPEYIETIKNS